MTKRKRNTISMFILIFETKGSNLIGDYDHFLISFIIRFFLVLIKNIKTQHAKIAWPYFKR